MLENNIIKPKRLKGENEKKNKSLRWNTNDNGYLENFLEEKAVSKPPKSAGKSWFTVFHGKRYEVVFRLVLLHSERHF